MIEIKENFRLKNYNTFGIDIYTRFFVECESSETILDFLNIYCNQQLPLMILGGGSNVLFTRDYEGYILRPNIKGVEIINETDSEIEIKVGAGEDWDEFVDYCVNQGWGGIENLSLIPGNVGTCPIQNIGAYGVEVKELITTVDTIEISSKEKFSFNNEDCEFGYRDSIFKRKLKGKHIITNVNFKLSKRPEFKLNYGNLSDELKKQDKINLKTIRQAIINIRDSKLPKPEDIGNAGSFFKNPIIKKDLLSKLQHKYPDIPKYEHGDNKVKIPAGWLIEKAGWKGKRNGNVGVHEKQALVLVNYGNATGEEVFLLAKNIQESVKEKFGIDIEMEVNLV